VNDNTVKCAVFLGDLRSLQKGWCEDMCRSDIFGSKFYFL